MIKALAFHVHLFVDNVWSSQLDSPPISAMRIEDAVREIFAKQLPSGTFLVEATPIEPAPLEWHKAP